MENKWKFFIDKGGTFTDILGVNPNGEILVHKVLSRTEVGDDPTLVGIKKILKNIPVSRETISEIKLGTTIGTNALLERKGAKTGLLVTKGFRDILEIGYQQRPEIFELNIIKHEQVYGKIVEVEERILADGSIKIPLNLKLVELSLSKLKEEGFESLSIVLLHSLKNPEHELAIQKLAEKYEFSNVTLSHRIQVPKIVPRGDTSTVDAYLSPIIQQYAADLGQQFIGIPLYFMQSGGGLVKSNFFKGVDSIFSGPAGGIVGAVSVAKNLGHKNIIGFDMGGTSTDVFHFAGDYERSYEKILTGIRICTPMLDLNTLAAGGGSIIKFEDRRLQVGPASAGAYPGPLSYGWNGPLAITDCNLLLGRIIPYFFPKIFFGFE